MHPSLSYIIILILCLNSIYSCATRMEFCLNDDGQALVISVPLHFLYSYIRSILDNIEKSKYMRL